MHIVLWVEVLCLALDGVSLPNLLAGKLKSHLLFLLSGSVGNVEAHHASIEELGSYGMRLFRGSNLKKITSAFLS